MSRSSHTRAPRVAAAVVALGMAAPLAHAQEASPEPVVERAPKRVRFKGTAVVKARLDDGAPADEVALEKRTRPGTWEVLQRKRVGEDRRARFRLKDRRTTSSYRLSWVAPTAEESASGDPFRIAVRPKLTIHVRPRHAFSGERVVVRGVLRPARRGRKVRVQRRVGGAWRTVDRAPAGDGTYRVAFTARRPRRTIVRAIFAGDGDNTRRRRNRRLKVYDPDLASWYGPGFYGNRTACGRTLRRGTVGVAHRSLPCGTMVDVLYRGRTLRVPVIDRGPYTSAEWDLTEETARRLRFSGRNTVGTVH